MELHYNIIFMILIFQIIFSLLIIFPYTPIFLKNWFISWFDNSIFKKIIKIYQIIVGFLCIGKWNKIELIIGILFQKKLIEGFLFFLF